MYCFTLHFVPAVDNGDKNITCQFFQILSIGAFLRPEINSLHRYDSCCDNIFVSEHNSKFWESIWKNWQKTNNIQIINSQMLQFFSVKRLNYVSNGNWLSSFTQGNSQSPTDHSKLKCIKWELQRTVSDATKKNCQVWNIIQLESTFSGQIYWGVLSCLHAKRLGKWGEYW